ncbi:MAG TPA: V-type ATP synthase subunit F [Clostridiaceae bacterium]|nr:V-type ATP synthase subunit F [Clostridiaceae bacterium]
MHLVKVAVIGDIDSVIGFRGIGMTVVTTDDPLEAYRIIEELVKKQYGVIFVTEDLAEKNPAIIEDYKEKIEPAIILIPSSRSNEQFALRYLQEMVNKAIGIDLLKEDNNLT